MTPATFRTVGGKATNAMFSTPQQLAQRTGANTTDRFHYLQELVTEFRTTADQGSCQSTVALLLVYWKSPYITPRQLHVYIITNLHRSKTSGTRQPRQLCIRPYQLRLAMATKRYRFVPGSVHMIENALIFYNLLIQPRRFFFSLFFFPVW